MPRVHVGVGSLLKILQPQGRARGLFCTQVPGVQAVEAPAPRCLVAEPAQPLSCVLEVLLRSNLLPLENFQAPGC